MLCWRYVCPSGSDFPMKMTSLQSGSRIPEVYHFRPLRTYSSPSRRIVAVMLRASEPAVASSDARNITATILREGDEYVLNGRKWYTSGILDPEVYHFRPLRTYSSPSRR